MQIIIAKCKSIVTQSASQGHDSNILAYFYLVTSSYANGSKEVASWCTSHSLVTTNDDVLLASNKLISTCHLNKHVAANQGLSERVGALCGCLVVAVGDSDIQFYLTCGFAGHIDDIAVSQSGGCTVFTNLIGNGIVTHSVLNSDSYRNSLIRCSTLGLRIESDFQLLGSNILSRDEVQLCNAIICRYNAHDIVYVVLLKGIELVIIVTQTILIADDLEIVVLAVNTGDSHVAHRCILVNIGELNRGQGIGINFSLVARIINATGILEPRNDIVIHFILCRPANSQAVAICKNVNTAINQAAVALAVAYPQVLSMLVGCSCAAHIGEGVTLEGLSLSDVVHTGLGDSELHGFRINRDGVYTSLIELDGIVLVLVARAIVCNILTVVFAINPVTVPLGAKELTIVVPVIGKACSLGKHDAGAWIGDGHSLGVLTIGIGHLWLVRIVAPAITINEIAIDVDIGLIGYDRIRIGIVAGYAKLASGGQFAAIVSHDNLLIAHTIVQLVIRNAWEPSLALIHALQSSRELVRITLIDTEYSRVRAQFIAINRKGSTTLANRQLLRSKRQPRCGGLRCIRSFVSYRKLNDINFTLSA